MATQQDQPNKQRINMTHGFMKSVIRNQIDRDNYDKEVKAKQQHGHSKHHYRSSQGKPRKPEIQTYVPPQRFKKGSTESHQHLYRLEYEHKNGDVHTVHVYKSDAPEDIARRVGEKFDLPEAFMEALARQIQEEMDKRSI